MYFFKEMFKIKNRELIGKEDLTCDKYINIGKIILEKLMYRPNFIGQVTYNNLLCKFIENCYIKFILQDIHHIGVKEAFINNDMSNVILLSNTY